MTEKAWGGISRENWQTVPHISDRLATESDVKEGRAVFYLERGNEIGAQCFTRIVLPRPAILTDEETGERIPVVAVQAEVTDDQVYVGYRFLNGGNGICLLSQLEVLDNPDERFWRDSALPGNEGFS